MLAVDVGICLNPQETFVVAQFMRHLGSHGREPFVSRKFVLDFALVFHHHTDDSGRLVIDAPEEPLWLSEDDVLRLLELIPPTAMVGNSPVGMTIHRKLYEAILRVHPEQVSEVWFGEEDEPSRLEVDPQLRKLSRRRGRKK